MAEGGYRLMYTPREWASCLLLCLHRCRQSPESPRPASHQWWAQLPRLPAELWLLILAAADPVWVVDLTGLWRRAAGFDFWWESLQLFRRLGGPTGSTHCHDYWAVFGEGACLATTAHFAAVRYNPRTGYLVGTPAARRRRVGQPHLVLGLPGRRLLLLDLCAVQEAVRRGWRRGGRWRDPEAAYRHFSRGGIDNTTLRQDEPTLKSALRPWRDLHNSREIVPRWLRERDGPTAAEGSRTRPEREGVPVVWPGEVGSHKREDDSPTTPQLMLEWGGG